MNSSEPVDLATYEGTDIPSMFNKGVRSQDKEQIGQIMMETDDKIVVYGH
ncbi:MAG: hypothetical protein ACREBU_03125 [Nitrososphaera sp.]